MCWRETSSASGVLHWMWYLYSLPPGHSDILYCSRVIDYHSPYTHVLIKSIYVLAN